MSAIETKALEKAKEQGYLLQSLGVHYPVSERWFRWCKKQCIPCIIVKGHGKYRSITCDMETVYPIALLPTPSFRSRLQEVFTTYQIHGGWGEYYTSLLKVPEQIVPSIMNKLLTIVQESIRSQGNTSFPYVMWEERS